VLDLIWGKMEVFFAAPPCGNWIINEMASEKPSLHSKKIVDVVGAKIMVLWTTINVDIPHSFSIQSGRIAYEFQNRSYSNQVLFSEDLSMGDAMPYVVRHRGQYISQVSTGRERICNYSFIEETGDLQALLSFVAFNLRGKLQEARRLEHSLDFSSIFWSETKFMDYFDVLRAAAVVAGPDPNEFATSMDRIADIMKIMASRLGNFGSEEIVGRIEEPFTEPCDLTRINFRKRPDKNFVMLCFNAALPFLKFFDCSKRWANFVDLYFLKWFDEKFHRQLNQFFEP
jgi:hypothetical protein